MQDWKKDDIWIAGGDFMGDNRPRGVVTVEKDWGVRESPAHSFETPMVERHMFYPGTVRWFQRADYDPSRETEIPGVKTINLDKSIDSDAASATIVIRNTRPVGYGETVERPVTGAGSNVPQLEQYGDPGYLTPGRGASQDAQERWGYVDEQPVVHLGIEGTSFIAPGRAKGGGGNAAYASPGFKDILWAGELGEPENFDVHYQSPAWGPVAPQGVSAIGAITDSGDGTYIQSLFANASPNKPRGFKAPFPKSIYGGARAFVTGSTAITDPKNTGVYGIQVHAHVANFNTNEVYKNINMDMDVWWEPGLMIYDPDYVVPGNSYLQDKTRDYWAGIEGEPDPRWDQPAEVGKYLTYSGGAVHMTANASPDVFVSSEVFRENPATGEKWTLAEINKIVNGANTGSNPSAFGVRAFTKSAYDLPNGFPNATLSPGALRIYGIWCDVIMEPEPDSWAQVLTPNALLRTYEGYGGHDLSWDEAYAEGNLLRTGTWMVDRVEISTNGDMTLECRDMAKLLITQPLMPPLIPPLEYPMRWVSNFADRIPTYNQGKGKYGEDGSTVGSGPPKGERSPDPVGNYKDFTEIVRWFLLWSGFWLYNETEEWALPWSIPTVPVSNPPRYRQKVPVVFGNLETTGSTAQNPLNPDLFDKQKVIDGINAIKELVGYIFRVDHDGAARFEPPNFFSNGNFYPTGHHTTFMYQIDESVNLIDFGINHSDDDVRSEIIISSYEPTVALNDTITTRFTTPNRRSLRGMIRPFAWVNESFTRRVDQRKMAELVGLHIWFSQRQGNAQCAANPALEIDDQVQFWERQTSETYIHYVRGIQTTHDLESGEYLMTLTTHWLGTPEDWKKALGWQLSTSVYNRIRATQTWVTRPDMESVIFGRGKVYRGELNQ